MRGSIFALLMVCGSSLYASNPYQCFNYGDNCMCNPCQTGVCYGPTYNLYCECNLPIYKPLIVTLHYPKCFKTHSCRSERTRCQAANKASCS
jgi:hypothetical protein